MDESLAAALEREHRQIDAGIESFTSDTDPASSDVTSLERAIGALRRHIYLEEEFLFPALNTNGGDNLVAPIFVMLREHGQMWQTLDELQSQLHAGAEPRALLERCHQLGVQLLHHNMKEERVIYPVADDALSPEATGRLQELIETGELPEGWVCNKAR